MTKPILPTPSSVPSSVPAVPKPSEPIPRMPKALPPSVAAPKLAKGRQRQSILGIVLSETPKEGLSQEVSEKRASIQRRHSEMIQKKETPAPSSAVEETINAWKKLRKESKMQRPGEGSFVKDSDSRFSGLSEVVSVVKDMKSLGMDTNLINKVGTSFTFNELFERNINLVYMK
jgi:hypothetical protein